MNKNYKGFSLIELLIVVAIILVVAALAILNLLRAKIAANQSSAVGSLRARSSVQAAFQSTYNDGYATSLARLHGAGVTCAAPGLIDPILAAGAKSSYNERYTNDGVVVGVAAVLSGCAAWGSTGFNSGNNPLSVTTGTNHYCIDETGVLRQGAAALASPCTTSGGLRSSRAHARRSPGMRNHSSQLACGEEPNP
jgi:type IV pilus assembly protein PilA